MTRFGTFGSQWRSTAVAVAVAVMAVGSGLWLCRDHVKPVQAKSDCQIVKDMLDFNTRQVDLINKTVHDSRDGDPPYDSQSADLIKGLQGYIDQIGSPQLRAKAQGLVDTNREMDSKNAVAQKQIQDSLATDPVHEPPAATVQLERDMQRMQDEQTQIVKDLHRSCPGTRTVPAA